MPLIQFLERHMLTCPSKALLHIDCPGCGMQRSFIALLKGNLSQSLALHPATIPTIALFLIVVLHIVFKFRHGARAIIFLYATIVIVTLVFYIYKITHKLL